MREPSFTERIAENDLIQATVGAASVVLPLTAADPGIGLVAQATALMFSTVSGIAYRKRLGEHVAEIVSELRALEERVQQMSLAQTKFAAETLNTLLRTVEEEKIAFLRKAIRNAVVKSDLKQSEATILARVIRDISAEELAFLQSLQGADVVAIAESGNRAVQAPTDEHGKLTSVYQIEGTDSERLLIMGLTSLGLAHKLNVWSERYALNPVCRRLVALVAE